jgi:hypothetical protein
MLLLALELLQVKLELLALQNIAIRTTGLAGARSNARYT